MIVSALMVITGMGGASRRRGTYLGMAVSLSSFDPWHHHLPGHGTLGGSLQVDFGVTVWKGDCCPPHRMLRGLREDMCERSSLAHSRHSIHFIF